MRAGGPLRQGAVQNRLQIRTGHADICQKAVVLSRQQVQRGRAGAGRGEQAAKHRTSPFGHVPDMGLRLTFHKRIAFMGIIHDVYG